MQLWSAIFLAGLAMAAPVQPNGAGTLETREPILLPNHPSATGAEGSDDAALGKRGRAGIQPVSKLPLPPSLSPWRFPAEGAGKNYGHKRDVTNEQAAERALRARQNFNN
ncbi:hypothetical protein GGTG_13288 [Gaeumannomyces tritici R3-111a-1]|uniref:Uncharacterized protein n=1 Tax=Gaeumannomyces tritici (strain R3-111a-1) TaxID=644352 RepID=J3PIG0_GAET3|nr:hypothetical protein GGTG_13288 [Gaeumannomyces tritici R3-111a-1]EJT69179.1 hypothetical protein GGTG_13288 [Gaeumannomyces tritici R3-111a-1]